MYRAIVEENIDPKSRGRVRFSIYGDKLTPKENLPWAEYCSPFGGGNNTEGAGFFFVPEVGSQIWIINEDGGNPVWIGSSFYGIGGRQNPPIEVSAPAIEPLIRGIKTPAGNKLFFDDRTVNERGDTPVDVTLVNKSRSGLTINDANGSGRGIRLGFGNSGGELKMVSQGLVLKSNGGSGLFINDNQNIIRLADKENKGFLIFQDRKMVAYADGGILIETPSKTFVNSLKGLFIDASAGKFDVQSSTINMVSGGDVKFQTGNNFNVNSNQYNLTGQLGSNFTLDLPIPGIPGLNQGNILLQTAGGGILIRNGISIAIPGTPPVNPLVFTSNDASMPLFAGRLGIGDTTTGNAFLEGRLGGIFISGSPIPLPGSAGGLGGRLPIPYAPIIPTGFPGAPQPGVLGGNLFQLLTQLNTALLTFLGIMTASSPSFTISAVGPGALNPGVIAGLAVLQTQLTTLQMTFFNPAPGGPLQLLSSTVFLDG
jgi:hypothetical protein